MQCKLKIFDHALNDELTAFLSRCEEPSWEHSSKSTALPLSYNPLRNRPSLQELLKVRSRPKSRKESNIQLSARRTLPPAAQKKQVMSVATRIRRTHQYLRRIFLLITQRSALIRLPRASRDLCLKCCEMPKQKFSRRNHQTRAHTSNRRSLHLPRRLHICRDLLRH